MTRPIKYKLGAYKDKIRVGFFDADDITLFEVDLAPAFASLIARDLAYHAMAAMLDKDLEQFEGS